MELDTLKQENRDVADKYKREIAELKGADHHEGSSRKCPGYQTGATSRRRRTQKYLDSRN